MLEVFMERETGNCHLFKGLIIIITLPLFYTIELPRNGGTEAASQQDLVKQQSITFDREAKNKDFV